MRHDASAEGIILARDAPGFKRSHTRRGPMRLHRCFDRRLVEDVSRTTCGRGWSTRSADGSRPSALNKCPPVAPTMRMRVGFTSGTRPGPPIEERKRCERGRLKAPPHRESSSRTAHAAHGLVDQIGRALHAVAARNRSRPHHRACPAARRIVARSCVTPISFDHDVTRHMTHPMESGAARRSASSTVARFVSGSGVPQSQRA